MEMYCLHIQRFFFPVLNWIGSNGLDDKYKAQVFFFYPQPEIKMQQNRWIFSAGVRKNRGTRLDHLVKGSNSFPYCMENLLCGFGDFISHRTDLTVLRIAQESYRFYSLISGLFRLEQFYRNSILLFRQIRSNV